MYCYGINEHYQFKQICEALEGLWVFRLGALELSSSLFTRNLFWVCSKLRCPQTLAHHSFQHVQLCWMQVQFSRHLPVLCSQYQSLQPSWPPTHESAPMLSAMAKMYSPELPMLPAMPKMAILYFLPYQDGHPRFIRPVPPWSPTLPWSSSPPGPGALLPCRFCPGALRLCPDVLLLPLVLSCPAGDALAPCSASLHLNLLHGPGAKFLPLLRSRTTSPWTWRGDYVTITSSLLAPL